MSRLRAGTPITVETITLIPIERVRILSGDHSQTCWLSATIEPHAVVICDDEGPRAVDVEAHELPVGALTTEIPELQALLAAVVRS